MISRLSRKKKTIVALTLKITEKINSIELKIGQMCSGRKKKNRKSNSSSTCRTIWRATKKARMRPQMQRKMPVSSSRSCSAKKVNIPLRMGLSTVVSGLGAFAMVLGSKLGQMGRGMRESGRITRRMAGGSFIMSMEMFLMVNGPMIKHMDSVLISMLMDPNTRGIGSMTSKMVKEKKLGKMALFMRACIVKAISMGRAGIFGVMGACTSVNG